MNELVSHKVGEGRGAKKGVRYPMKVMSGFIKIVMGIIGECSVGSYHHDDDAIIVMMMMISFLLLFSSFFL